MIFKPNIYDEAYLRDLFIFHIAFLWEIYTNYSKIIAGTTDLGKLGKKSLQHNNGSFTLSIV